MRRRNVEISRTLRLTLLKPILEGKGLDDVSKEVNINIKALKHQLTYLYKYYGVRNRYELMAQYIKFPSELYKYIPHLNIQRPSGRKESFLLKKWKEHK
jgi:hypothetical protein